MQQERGKQRPCNGLRAATYGMYFWDATLADCMGEPIGNELPRSNHEASLLTIQTLFGWVSGSDEFIKALEAQPIAAAHEQR